MYLKYDKQEYNDLAHGYAIRKEKRYSETMCERGGVGYSGVLDLKANTANSLFKNKNGKNADLLYGTLLRKKKRQNV